VAQLTSPGNLDSEWVKSLISPDDLQSFGPDALSVINTLMERDWRIVHIAGHGAPAEMLGPAPKRRGDPPQQVGDPRGVVLSGESFLGPREIHSMRVAPELVFVNCCHLAARNVQTVLKRDESQRGGTYDRAQFAATVAEELIKIGVRCVIAAGWAVDDDAAKTFATTLYAALLRGERFIDAVGGARIEAWKKGGNTWAAYQCYGDPDWVFRRAVGDAQQPTPPLADEFAGIASAPALTLALETLAIKSKYQNASPKSQLEKIRHLEKTFVHEWGSMGAVAEAFGVAYAEAKDAPAAIDWYSKALAANDGSASIKATEQLGNLRARSAWEAVQQAYKKTGQRGVVQLDKARAEIGAALKLLEGLTHLQPSIERESLCGSAWKRLALLERIAERPNDELAAIAQMKAFYGQAETRARENRDPGLFYPALNRMAAELVVDAAKPGWSGFDSAIVAEVRECLTTKAHDDPDFWSIAGLTELRLYLAMAGATLAREASSIEREFTDLRNRVSARWMWSSVNDQASFVLPTYSARVGGADRKAAEHLQALLRTFAQEK
jgi:tetratricopeptide (TPR) repeat protein